MPYFSTQPSSSLSASIRRLIGGSGGLGPMQEMQIDQAAANTAHRLSLVDKVRAESEALRNAERARADPATTTRFATHSAGLDEPTGERLAGHLRGDMEQPSPADIDDAAVVGREAQPFRMGAPNVNDGQRRLFQSAITAAIANRLATGKTNAQQLTMASGNVQGDKLTEEAITAPSNGIANRIIAASAGKTYQPFRVGPQGQVLDQGSGDLDESGDIPQGQVGLLAARAREAAAKGRFADAGVPLRGAQTRLAGARADQVVAGKPATPIAPQRVARMIDMSTLAEFKAEKAAWDALPVSKRNSTPAPTMAGVRERVAGRYAQPDTQAEIAEAQDAIARGAPEATVRARFKQRKGFDLPAQVAAAGATDDEEED